jgi:hypothetical protein
MNTAVDKYYPGLRDGKVQGVVWNPGVTNAWVSGLEIERAVKGSGVSSSGTIDAAAMMQGLNSIKNDTMDGWTSPLTFTAGQPHPVHCWFEAKWANGTPTILNNKQPVCGG